MKKLKKLMVALAGRVRRTPERAKIGRGKTAKVAPGRSFDRLAGRYPVEPEPVKSVEQQIEATRTKEISFTDRQRGNSETVRISSADTDGVRQSEEMEYQQGSFNVAHNPLFAGSHYDEDKTKHPRPGIAWPAVVGDALGKNFATFDTVQYRKMPHWMRSKTKWKQFREKLAVRKVTFNQNIALLTLSFERVGHSDEEIFETFWDAQGQWAEPDDNNVLIVPNWPFKTIRQMVDRRTRLLSLGNQMFGAEPKDRARQRRPYRRLLCDEHSERWLDRDGDEQARPIKVVAYLGGNKYRLECGCNRTVTDYTAPGTTGERKRIVIAKAPNLTKRQKIS